MTFHSEIHIGGPITQTNFLQNMGIEYRLISLLSKLQENSDATSLISGFDRLTNPKEMGENYKAIGGLWQKKNIFQKTPEKTEKISYFPGFDFLWTTK